VSFHKDKDHNPRRHGNKSILKKSNSKDKGLSPSPSMQSRRLSQDSSYSRVSRTSSLGALQDQSVEHTNANQSIKNKF